MPSREPLTTFVPPAADAVSSAAYEAATRLMESLLHDARNPLNALAINLEVLTEKLKDDDGKVPETQEKNIRAMRDQVYRVDGILRQFADFMTPRPVARGEVNLSELVQRALEVVAHESRRRRVKLKVAVEANVTLASAEAARLNLVLIQTLLRAIARSEAGTEASVVLDHQGEEAVLTVSDPSVDGAEPLPLAPEAIRVIAAELGGRAAVSGGTVQIFFPIRG